MKEADVHNCVFAIPLTGPSCPPGPYRSINREFLVTTYRSDPEKLRSAASAYPRDPHALLNPILAGRCHAARLD